MATDPADVPQHRPLAVLIIAMLGVVVAGGAVLALLVVGGGLTGPGTGPEDMAGPSGPSTAATTATAPLTDGYRVWARNDDGMPVRWDPCRPIELVVDDTGAPDGFEADLGAAIDTVEAASGLQLRVVGQTDERPSGDRASYQPGRYGERWAPVLIAWAGSHEADLPLRPFDRGVAMPVAVGPPGDQSYVTGQVVFNLERTDLRAGDEDRARSWGATILHELVHLVGLGHVDDPDELMYTYPGSGPVELGPGDRAGLRELGGEGACRPAPRPGPVVMTDRP
jgi:hypothetical protein